MLTTMGSFGMDWDGNQSQISGSDWLVSNAVMKLTNHIAVFLDWSPTSHIYDPKVCIVIAIVNPTKVTLSICTYFYSK